MHPQCPIARNTAALAAALALAVPVHAAERALDKSVVVNATLDQAWQAWTTREGIVSFFAPDARVEARPGGPFEIYIDPGGAPGMKGADDMRVLAVQPKQLLSFEWNAPPHLPEARQQRTVVILRFEPVTDTSTRVRLHHVGWGDGGQWDQAYAYFDRAWGNVLANLQKRFDSGPVDWTAWLQQLEQMRAAAKPK
ncbi:SRPBCC family protein [Rubrivivax sp. RP6-9]|uniref:SRPBCC family protein n=1 Tax=Rubrivivax sp. RP6-9 TaxID=3415750 RepID=UPI003CC6C52E